MSDTPKRADDLAAGNAVRDSLVPRADAYRGPAPLWHGWAIMEAYLAGVAAERARCATAANLVALEGYDETPHMTPRGRWLAACRAIKNRIVSGESP